MNIKRHKALASLIFLIFAMPANAAEVIKLEIDIGKNDSSSKNTNIITIDDKKVRVDYLGTESKKDRHHPFFINLKCWKVLGHRQPRQR